MKKILTVLTAVLLLCCMGLSLASCGSVDMNEVKTTLEELDKKGELNADIDEDLDDKTTLKRFAVSTKAEDYDDREYLYIVQYASTKYAKIQEKIQKMQNEYQEEYKDLLADQREERLALGASVSELDEDYEVVIKRKGDVLIYGSKALYEKVFG